MLTTHGHGIEESRQRDEQYPGTRNCGDNLGKRIDTNCDRISSRLLQAHDLAV
ncbi:MAG: hypothetical protein V7K94_04690 [Nostoc sp.]|uniref:hypothetical protein n=1 Tax=Nostoc sp. TaxID=1180 RepID=UPI002FF95EB4